MIFSSMTSIISSERRLAWSRSRHVDKTKMEEVDSVALIMSLSEFTFQDLDDAFLDEGCPAEMIQNWLKNCSSCTENSCEDVPFNPKVFNCRGSSLDDDFSLGAEATFLCNHHRNRISVLLDRPNLKTMNLGNSMTSNATTKTSSSISEVLALCQADAETILYNLGFACERTCSMYKIPSRFFLIPSKAEGISFTKYFESVSHRMKIGDSSYIPADDELLNDILYTLPNSYPFIRTPEKRNAHPRHSTHEYMSIIHEYISSERTSFLLS